MKSKVVIILVVLLVVGVGVGFWLTRKPAGPVVSPLRPGGEQERAVEPTKAVPELLLWSDQAGFTFQYPKGLAANKHDEDNVNYAHIDLLPEGKIGGILVLASDSKYKTLDEWTKKDKELAGGNVLEATLGGEPAKKVLSADGETITIGVIDSEILFKIRATAYSNSTIKGIFDQVVSTFKFVNPTPAASSGKPSAVSGSSESDVIEEEEIIE